LEPFPFLDLPEAIRTSLNRELEALIRARASEEEEGAG
jgi:hypothetical protein